MSHGLVPSPPLQDIRIHCLIIGALFLACHAQGSRSPVADGAAGGENGEGSGGSVTSMGGGSGRGGSGDTSTNAGGSGGGAILADGAAPDLAGRAEVADGQAPATAKEACRAAIEIQCARRAQCNGTTPPSLPCGHEATPCPDYYFNSNSNRTVADVVACLDKLAAMTCADYVLGIYPSCLAHGKLAGGSGCAYSSECQSGACRTEGPACGACVGPSPLGASCGDWGCADGAFCHRTTRTCTAVSTIVYATLGQACDIDASPAVACASDLICQLGSSGGTTGTCVPAPAVGQPCGTSDVGYSGICAAGAVCNGSSTGTCVPDGSCGSGVQCDGSSYCPLGATTCVTRAAIGQSCSDSRSSGSPPCLAPAACSTTTRKCQQEGDVGDACDATHGCAPMLTCSGATCQPLGPCQIDGGT